MSVSLSIIEIDYDCRFELPEKMAKDVLNNVGLFVVSLMKAVPEG